MPDTATITLDPSEVQEASSSSAVPTLDPSEVADNSAPTMSKTEASAALDQYSGNMGNRPVSRPAGTPMPQFTPPSQPLDAASQAFEQNVEALPEQERTEFQNAAPAPKTIAETANYRPQFALTGVHPGNITKPAQPAAPKMQTSAERAAAAVSQDPNVRFGRAAIGTGPAVQTPVGAAVQSAKTGASEMKQGLDMLGPDFAPNSDPKQLAVGYTHLMNGIMTATGPEVTLAMGENPWPFIKGMVTGAITGEASKKLVQAAGGSPEYQELAKTAGFFLPTVAGALTGAQGMLETRGVTTRGTAEAFGGGAKGGFEVDPYTVKVAGRVGRTGIGAEFERFPGAKAQRAANYGQEAAPPPPDPAMQQHQADTAAAVKALTDGAAADANAARQAAGVPPPPPPKPPMPAGMDQGELRPAVVSNLAKMVQIAPPQMRAGMFLEAHAQLAGWLGTQRTVILPDGKMQVIDSPKKAETVAQDILNNEVERHQQAHQDMLDQRAEQQKQAEEQAKEETEQAASQPNEKGEEENPLLNRAKTILAANQDAPPVRQVALLQRQLRVGPGLAQQLHARVTQALQVPGTGNMVGSSTHPVTEEPREQIDQQIASLAGGTVPVVHLPEGTQYRPAIPPGMKMIRVSGDAPGAGMYLYNPAKIQAAAIKEAAKNGTHGDLLGHIAQKEDIPGMKVPAVLQAKAADGTPIQESVVDAADPAMVRAQAEALRERHPGAAVQARHPKAAINERDHALARSATNGGDIFDHIAQQRGKEESHAEVRKQAAGEMGQQPNGPEGTGTGGSSETERGQQGREATRQGTGAEEVATHAQGAEGGRGEPERAGQSGKAAPAKYDYGNTQADIPAGSDAAKALAAARSRIDKADLAPTSHGGNDEGLETEPHITVRYGIKGEDTAGIRAFLEKQAPFEATLGASDAFPPSKSSDGTAPIIAPVESSDLRRIEAELDKHGDFIDRTFPEYKPHATIAYVKPEAIDKYKGMPETKGKTFLVRSISISKRDGSTESVPLHGERRRDTAERRRIAEMSPEEMRRELLTSDKTGLPNRRAFEDAEHAAPAKAIAMSDADGLKALNDRYGYAAGDQLLKAKAEELQAAGVEAYHDKGDEFLYRGESPEELSRKLEVAREGLRNREIEVTMKDGTVRRFKGADFSYGIGKDADAAESKLKQHKAEREASGERARGELRGIQETGPEADRRREGAAEKAPLAKGDRGIRFRDDHGVERTGTVLHTNDRITRLRLGSGAENTVKNADVIGARPIPHAGEVGELHSSQMERSPKDFQYKVSNIGEGGVSNLLKGSEWNRDLSGIVSAWRDPATGKVYVVNGHHRHERAEATGGQNLAVRMLDVDNREQARAVGALQNIAEGRGTAIDAAKFMRDSGMTLEDLEKRGISMGEATAQNGVALARLDPSIFEQVAIGKLSERKGVAIGRATDNAATQEAIVKMIAKAEARGRHVSEGAVQELARFAASAGETEQTVESLFGNRVETQNLALEKADVSAYIQKQLRQEKTIFGAVSSEARAKTLSRTGNRIEAAKNAAEATAASQALEVYDRLSARRGPVDDALNAAAKDIADGKPANNAKQRAYEAVRAAVREALGSLEAEGTGRVQPDTGRGAEAQEEGRLSAQELEDAGQSGISFTPEIQSLFTRDRGPVSPRDATPEQQARAQRLTTSDPKFPYLDRAGVAKLYQQNLRRAVTEPETPTLPGLEQHVEAHTRSAEEVSAEALKQSGAKDISSAAGRMERDAPLFRESGASEQGALFTKPKPPQPGAGQQAINFEVPQGFTEHPVEKRTTYYRDAERAKNFSLNWNLSHARAIVHAAAEGGAPVVELNPHAYQAINKIIQASRNMALPDWGGCYFTADSARRLEAQIEEHSQKALGAGDDLLTALRSGRAPGGGIILLRGDIGQNGAREELAHWWFDQNIQRSGEARNMADALVASPVMQLAIRQLMLQGYPIKQMSDVFLLNEAMAKTLADAGGELMPLRSEDYRLLLNQALNHLQREMTTVTFRQALNALPEVSPAARAIIDAWRQRNDDLGRQSLPTTGTAESEKDLSHTRGNSEGSSRPPPEGADAGLLFTPQRQSAEPRGRDEVGFGATADGISPEAMSRVPGAEMAHNARAYVADQTEKVAGSRELSEGIAKLEKQYEADVIRAKQAMESMPGKAADQEAIYHFLENPDETLNPLQEQILSETLAPVQYESERIWQKLNAGQMPVDNYVHRIVRERGGLVDRIVQSGGVRKLTGKGNIFRKSAGALKRRTMMAIQHDTTGDRQVVSIKSGRVTQWKDGEPRDRGDLRSGLTTRLEDLDPHLEAVAKNIVDTDQAIRDLPRSDRQAAADKLQKQIDKLEATLSTVAGRKAEAGKAGQLPGNLRREIASLTAKRDTVLSTPLDRYKLSSRGEDQMRRLKEKQTTYTNQRARLLEKIPTEHMMDKLWKDKDGRNWRITQATTKEIEAHTGLRYYHNAAASVFSNYLELRKAERAFDYLEAYKSSPEFARIAVHPSTQVATGKAVDVPEGWQTTTLPTFAGYYFEPHVAEVLDQYAKQLQAKGPSVFEKVGAFLRTAIFFNPLMHIPNLLSHWAVEKGVSGLVNPFGYGRSLRALVKAVDAVSHQNQDFLDALDAGGALQSQKFETQQFADVMMKKIVDEMERDPSTLAKLARALGYADPRKLIAAVYKFSGRATWYSNDILFLQSAYEKVAKGVTLEAALRETGKHIPTYRLPARIFNSKAMATLMSNPNLTMFGAYHYGALASYGKALRSVFAPAAEAGENAEGDGVNEAGRTSTEERAHGLDIMAAIGLMTFVALPAIDQVLKRVTGNSRAELRRPGASTFVYNLTKLIEGEETPVEFAESVVTPAVGTKAAVELAFNRDLRTGHNLYDPHAPAKELGRQAGEYAASQVGPLNQMQRVQQGSMDLRKMLYQMVGVGFPLHGPERRAIEINAAKLSALPQKSAERRHGILRSRALHDAWDGDFRALNKLDASDEFTEKEKRAIWKESMESPLLAQTHSMGYDEVLSVYHAHGATPEEKELLREVLDRKLANLIKGGKDVEDEEKPE
jgi:GGDEF domain-containing protein